MSNARQKSKKMSNQQWASIVDRYYDGEDPYILANDMRSDPSLVFDHIKKDRRSRAKKGLPPRTRKETNSAAAEESINIENSETIIEGEKDMKKKIPVPENFIEVYTSYENKKDGIITINDAAEKLNVSPATFGRWRAAYKEYLERQENPQIKEYIEEKETIEDPHKMPFINEPKSEEKEEVTAVEVEIEDVKSSEEPSDPTITTDAATVNVDSDLVMEHEDDTSDNLTLVFEDRPVYKVGLVADRHNMPVSTYIFPGALDKNLMWDYNAQDRVVEQFILKNIGTRKNVITGKREAKQDMVLYVSGIQCCLCSVIKQCYAYGINLTVMHYDSEKDIYHPQHVIVGKRAGVEDMFKANRLQLLDCEFSDITSAIDYYAIKKIKYNKDGKAVYIDEIISPYTNNIYNKAIDMVRDILMDRSDRYRICLNLASIKDNKEQELERILDTKNWR